MYKSRHPDDTDDPDAVGMSSEDEAEGMCERLKSQNRVSTDHEADWQSWQAVSSSTGYK